MKKKILRISILAVVLFLLYNVVWSIIVNQSYKDYIIGFNEIHSHRSYAMVCPDGYAYNVKFPDYLSFVGNLGVQQNNGGNCALIIWPGILNETEYGVIIKDSNGKNYAISYTSEGIPTIDTPEDVKAVAYEYADEISTLFDKANEMWKIN